MSKEEEFHYLEDGYYVEKLEQEIERLNNIIDKAIKYIKSNEFKASDGEICYFCNMKVIKDILNILNGGYEER